MTDTLTEAHRRAATRYGSDRGLAFRRGHWPTQGDDVLDADWYRAHGWSVTDLDDGNILVTPPATGGER